MKQDKQFPSFSLMRNSAWGIIALLIAAGIIIAFFPDYMPVGIILTIGVMIFFALRGYGKKTLQPPLPAWTEAEMLEVTERYRSVLRISTNYAIIGCDQNGIIKIFNDGAERILGYHAEEMIGKKSILCIHDPNEIASRARELGTDTNFSVFCQCSRPGDIETGEWTLIRRDGSRLPALLSFTPRNDENGKLIGYMGIAMDITERKQKEEAILKSEAQLRQKLDYILSPDADIGEPELAEIIDSATIQPMMENFSALTNMAVAILDLKGKIVVATGWQDICTKFHRINPETCKFCTESDLYLANNIKPGEYVSYRCKNNMWDVVTPLYIGEKYSGNIYTGQFFYDDEVIDEQIFIRQAEKFGFEQKAYIEALRRVPRFSRQRINILMDYLVRLTDYISRLSYSNLKQAKAVLEYRKAEEKLQHQFQFLQQLIDTIPNPVFYKDINGLYQGCNKAFEKVMNLPQQDIIGKSVYDLYPKEQADIYKKMDDELFASPGVQIYESQLPPLNGMSRTVVFNKATYLNADNSVAGLLGVILDITERKQAEEIIQIEREQLQSILNSIDEIIYIIDPRTYEVIYANVAARKLLKEDPIGKICHKTIFESDSPCDFCLNDKLFQEKSKSLKEEFHNPVTNRDYSISDRIIRWPDGRDVKMELAIDITERKHNETEKEKLREELLQAKKIEAIGRLAGGVAHDFNNMLQVILGHAEFLLKSLPVDSPLRTNIQPIQDAARHSSNLTRQLLAFARKQTVNPKVLDLNNTVGSMLKMLKRLIGENINLVWNPAEHLWAVKIDPSQVDQILANLTVNARDAISGTGTLSIETRNVVIDRTCCPTSKDITPGEFVMMAVSDTGCGMDQETINNLFEPFFTTKEMGRGTGLGLSTIFGAVKQNNGFINVYSEPGKGSTFKIYFPRCPEVPSGSNEFTNLAPVGGSETILLVEDDPAILGLGRFILEQNGYSVITATSPSEALLKANEHNGHIELLVTDVVMPQMNGRQLMEKISAISPGIKVIYMSGYTADVIAHHGILDKDINFLQKPFSEIAMTNCIRKVLDNGAADKS